MPDRFVESLQWIDHQQKRMVELLHAWANINSGSYHISGLDAQAAAMRPVLKELGGEIGERALPPQQLITDTGVTEAKPLGYMLSARSPARRGPRVLLAIHFDTVYGESHPFQAVMRVDEHTVRGPGVCDAKGGLLVLLFALMALERSPFAAGLNWEVLLNPDEELGSPGSARLFAEAARRNDMGLIYEPALPDGALVSSRKGSGTFTLVVRGRSAHAGRNAEMGRNAIHALAAVVTEMAAWQKLTPGVVVNTGFIHGGGAVNVVPDLAMCRVNIRVETIAQQMMIEQDMRALPETVSLPDGVTLECHGGFQSPPKLLTPHVESLLRHFATCGEQLGVPITWQATGGACDGNRLAAAGLPVVDSLGARGGNIHTDQEFVQLDSLAERAKLSALFLMRLAAGEIPLESVHSQPAAEVPTS